MVCFLKCKMALPVVWRNRMFIPRPSIWAVPRPEPYQDEGYRTYQLVLKIIQNKMIQVKLSTLLFFSLWEMAISQRPVQSVRKSQKLVKNCCISWHVINISDGAATHSQNRLRTGRQQHPCTWALIKDFPSSAILCVLADMRTAAPPVQADHWSACAPWQSLYGAEPSPGRPCAGASRLHPYRRLTLSTCAKWQPPHRGLLKGFY